MTMLAKFVPKDENLVNVLMHRYYPYWPLFALLLILTLMGAWGYIKYTDPSYEATATIIIKDQRKGVDDSRMTEAIDLFTSKKIVENEIEVIHSRALMKQVVVSLHLYAPVYESQRFKSYSAYLSSPVLVKLRNPEDLPESINDVKVAFFNYDSLQKKVFLDKENKAYPIDKWVNTPYGELMFFSNTNYTQSATGPLYFYFLHPQIVSDAILGELEVYPTNKLSTVITMKVKDKVPQRGEDILNQLIQSYHQLTLSDRNKLASNTLDFIEERIKHVERELNDLEGQVQKYKSLEGIVDLSEQGKVILQNESENDRRLADINIQLAVLEKVERYVLQKDNSAGIVPATLGLDDAVLSQLLNKLYDSEIQYQKLKKTTAENNPILASVAGEIESTRPSILENIRNQRENLLATRSKITLSKTRYSAALQSIPKQERELLEISRQKTIKNNVYSFLLQKREETALSYAPTAIDSKIVDVAESSIWPVSPNPTKIYFLAVVAAFLIGISLVTGREILNNKLLYRAEIAESTTLPIVAELSEMKRSKGVTFMEPTEVVIIEQFRQMRATMGLYGRNFSKKKILVTSSIPGEGKSFVSSNLALSLSATGKRTALIDFDLRNPSTSHQFGKSDKLGLTDYFIEEVGLDEIILSTQFNNLFVIPAGRTLGNITENMLHSNLNKVLSYLEDKFDYLVLDTPPVDLISDAYLLSEYCDLTLLVMRHNYTPKSIICNLNQSNKVKLLCNIAIVFNGVKSRGFINSGSYGYGYESNFKEKYLKHYKYSKNSVGSLFKREVE